MNIGDQRCAVNASKVGGAAARDSSRVGTQQEATVPEGLPCPVPEQSGRVAIAGGDVDVANGVHLTASTRLSGWALWSFRALDAGVALITLRTRNGAVGSGWPLWTDLTLWSGGSYLTLRSRGSSRASVTLRAGRTGHC